MAQESPHAPDTDTINKNWQFLGFTDAELSDIFLKFKNLGYTQPLITIQNFIFLLKDPIAKTLYDQKMNSCLDSLELVSFPTPAK